MKVIKMQHDSLVLNGDILSDLGRQIEVIESNKKGS